MVRKGVLSRYSVEFDNMLKTIQLKRKRRGLKPLSKRILTEHIAKKLKLKENLIYDKIIRI